MSTGFADRHRVPLLARRKARFGLAVVFGLVAGAVASLAVNAPTTRILLALTAFFAAYLFLSLRLSGLSATDLRAHTAEDDEGALTISVLGALAFAGSVVAVINVLSGPADPAEAIAGLLAIPLGWAVIHVMASHHYALLYYGADTPPDTPPPGGLTFPGGKDPAAIDFLYLAFGIGVATAVSDVDVTRPEMRRVVMIHSIASFVANTIVLALAVNAAASLDF